MELCVGLIMRPRVGRYRPRIGYVSFDMPGLQRLRSLVGHMYTVSGFVEARFQGYGALTTLDDREWHGLWHAGAGDWPCLAPAEVVPGVSDDVMMLCLCIQEDEFMWSFECPWCYSAETRSLPWDHVEKLEKQCICAG